MPAPAPTYEDTSMLLRQARPRTVSQSGAAGGSVLLGIGAGNRGLRLRVSQEQERGHGGGIRGGFVILDAGDNKHSGPLADLVGMVTDAAEVLLLLRQGSPGCVSVANANILTLEEGHRG